MLAALLFQHRRHLGGGLGRLPRGGFFGAGLSGRSVRFHHRRRALGRQSLEAAAGRWVWVAKSIPSEATGLGRAG